ncbi:MAG: MotA/TolQ/ExbB proton channel family protein, partial [Candidatus Omnitrophica bacterium]|nr:MotA/TolQ/ExbB proton channel family protein [Candidatus Omnitrophota bacterium]
MIFWDQNLWELFLKGGFAMWPLLACSVVGIAIMLEKSWYFFRLRLDYGRFSRELRRLLAEGDKKGATVYCRKHANPVPRIAEQYLKNLNDDFKRNEILKREGSFALEAVESRLRGLAAVAHLAPLLGLLGTVTGLVTAFHRIELLGGQVQAGDLASGIWEALITTVFGLVIAIPSMAAYHGFESATDRIARRMQFIVSELDELFGKRSPGNFR